MNGNLKRRLARLEAQLKPSAPVDPVIQVRALLALATDAELEELIAMPDAEENPRGQEILAACWARCRGRLPEVSVRSGLENMTDQELDNLLNETENRNM